MAFRPSSVRPAFDSSLSSVYGSAKDSALQKTFHQNLPLTQNYTTLLSKFHKHKTERPVPASTNSIRNALRAPLASHKRMALPWMLLPVAGISFFGKPLHWHRHHHHDSDDSGLQHVSLFATDAATPTTTQRLQEVSVRGDGNCQFRALSVGLHGTEDYHKNIRNNVANWLARNGHYPLDESGTQLQHFIDTDDHPEWSDYARYMNRDGAWGDHVSLIGAAETYGANIHVYSNVKGSAPVVITPKQTPAKKNLYLSHYHEAHYNALVPAHPQQEPPATKARL